VRSQQPADAVRALRTPIGLAGCGVEGLETLRYLSRHGVTDIRIFDRTLARQYARGEPLPAEVGALPVFGDAQWEAEMPQCGTIFRSPGVRPDHPALLAARATGATVTSATNWFLSHCPGRVVGVTGTVGKGTTATLVHEALTAAGLASRLAGNIGLNPLAFLDELTAAETVVLELSSFQVMDLGPAKPAVAVVLRTSEDHLDWHKDIAEYYRAKSGLIAPHGRLPDGRQQTVIYCADAPGSREVIGHALGAEVGAALAFSRTAPVAEGIGVRDGHVYRFHAGQARPLEPLEHLSLPGGFNLENAAAAFLAAEVLGAEPAQALTALAAFKGLPHRLERVGTVRGVACYNDSYATRPDATIAAIGAFDAPLALILGGSEKHADFRALADALCHHRSLREIHLIGATAGRLREEIDRAAARVGHASPPCIPHPDLPDAFNAGLAGLNGKGVLLMSPACASFGLFPNYKVRGERFKALVHAAAGE
jgi:UDP-N-acetylmuramoylalanine--D-glutamate ligase